LEWRRFGLGMMKPLLGRENEVHRKAEILMLLLS